MSFLNVIVRVWVTRIQTEIWLKAWRPLYAKVNDPTEAAQKSKSKNSLTLSFLHISFLLYTIHSLPKLCYSPYNTVTFNDTILCFMM